MSAWFCQEYPVFDFNATIELDGNSHWKYFDQFIKKGLEIQPFFVFLGTGFNYLKLKLFVLRLRIE